MANEVRYSFTYAELAKATGLTVNAIAQHRVRGHLNPESIVSVAAYLAKYGSKKTVMCILEKLIERQVPDDPGGWKKAAARKTQK